jgi:predicted small metal-binding protein
MNDIIKITYQWSIDTLQMQCAYWRAIASNDEEITALRRCHNNNVIRLDKIEKALREGGIQ